MRTQGTGYHLAAHAYGRAAGGYGAACMALRINEIGEQPPHFAAVTST